MKSKPTTYGKSKRLKEDYQSKCPICKKEIKKGQMASDAYEYEKQGRVTFKSFLKVHTSCS